MPKTTEVTINVAGIEAVEEAMADLRRRFLTIIRATCACQRCKDDAARLLKES